MRATSVEQTKVFEALKCKENGQAKSIVFGLTGTGYRGNVIARNAVTKQSI